MNNMLDSHWGCYQDHGSGCIALSSLAELRHVIYFDQGNVNRNNMSHVSPQPTFHPSQGETLFQIATAPSACSFSVDNMKQSSPPEKHM